MVKYLIYGASGWIGSLLVDLLHKDPENEVITAKSRLEDYPGIEKELDSTTYDFCINTAGLTGRPTVDGCESQKQQTILINVAGNVNLAMACWKRNIHLSTYASGCVYTYDAEHPQRSLTPGSTDGYKFTEEDPPNFAGSIYSVTKVHAQELLKNFPNVLTLRLRMPISDDLHPRNFITKIASYAKVINVPNSMTVLGELLPISLDMAKRKITGIVNLTQPGSISHNEILELYKKHVNPNFTWENFTVEEQDKILIAKRSNCELDTTKLTSLYEVTEVHEAIERVLQKIGESNRNKIK